jgi:hypothetical protein
VSKQENNPTETRRVAPSDTASLKNIIDGLTSKDGLRRQEARLQLVDIGSPVVPYLMDMLHHKRDWVRWEAAKALVEIGDAMAVPALVEALRDNMFEVRWLAAQGLIKIGWRSILPVVESLIEHSDSGLTRDGAHHVLHDLAIGQFQEPLQPLVKSLEGGQAAVTIPLVARKAMEALKPIEAQVIREDKEAKEKTAAHKEGD